MTRAHLSFFLLLFVFTAGFRPALAQRSVEDRITDRLVDRGFESVHVASVDGRLEVEFENRVFRYDVTAMQEAAEIVFSTTGAPDGLTLVPLRRGVRLASVQLNREGYLSLRRETAEPDEAPSIISARIDVPVRTYERRLSEIFSGGRNSSSFKLDVAVHPQLVAQFGSFSDAVRSQINLVPAASINLWYGMQLYGEVIVPVQNDLDEADDEVRPGIISANQTLRLPGGVFISASAGAFTRDRYGFDFEVLSSFIDGRIDVLGRIGRTGYARYLDGEWQYASLDRWTPTAGVRYNLVRYTLSTSVRYGRFLAGDTGIIINVDRYFGEFRIGFFGIATDAGENAGFRISIPLFMREHMRPRIARARSADRFDWTYRYRGLTDAGEDFDTGHALDEFRGPLVAPFIPSLWTRPKAERFGSRN